MRAALPIVTILALAAVGIAGVAVGERDDSPGLMLLGFLVLALSLWLGARTVRERRR